MRAYIQQIDITTDGKVVIKGQLSRTNLKVNLLEHIYVKEPEDGIWGYTIEVIPTAVIGADVMVPFVVEAPWTGNEEANGVRITHSNLDPNHVDYETVQLKVKKVDSYTTEQANLVSLTGACYDKSTNQLIIDVNYGGGCFPHFFSLEWDGSIVKSSPPQYNFSLVDFSELDPCEAILFAQIRFDIDTPDVQLERPCVINLSTLKSKKQIKIKID